jgi:hypothetical protein
MLTKKRKLSQFGAKLTVVTVLERRFSYPFAAHSQAEMHLSDTSKGKLQRLWG